MIWETASNPISAASGVSEAFVPFLGKLSPKKLHSVQDCAVQRPREECWGTVRAHIHGDVAALGTREDKDWPACMRRLPPQVPPNA